jgi:hypothetical protein
MASFPPSLGEGDFESRFCRAAGQSTRLRVECRTKQADANGLGNKKMQSFNIAQLPRG